MMRGISDEAWLRRKMPAPDATPTRVRTLRRMWLNGEDTPTGAEVSLPRHIAVELDLSGRVALLE